MSQTIDCGFGPVSLEKIQAEASRILVDHPTIEMFKGIQFNIDGLLGQPFVRTTTGKVVSLHRALNEARCLFTPIQLTTLEEEAETAHLIKRNKV